MKSSNNNINVGDRFVYWEVVGPGKGMKSICICRGCDKIQKEIANCILLSGKTSSCGCKNNEMRRKKAQEKYGVDNISQASQVKEKKKQTTLNNHGVEYPMQSKEVQEKAKETYLRDWGVEHISKSELIKEKKSGYFALQDPVVIARRESACLEKHGVKNYAQVKFYQDKQKQTMLERYGVDNPSKSSLIQEKKRQVSLERYGVDYPAQSLEAREQKLLSLDEEGKAARLSDGRFVSFLCDERGIKNKTHAYALLRHHGEEVLLNYLDNYEEKSLTDVEAMFCELIKDRFPNITIHDKRPLEAREIRNRPDFRLEHQGKVLYLNVDGLYYHCSLCIQDQAYHQKIHQAFDNHGLSIFQFRMNEIRDRPNALKSLVLGYFEMFDQTIDLNECTIESIDKEKANYFLNENHLMGGLSAFKGLALIHNNEPLALVAFKEVDDQSIQILRVAIKNFVNIKGAFKALLDNLKNQFPHFKIQIFQDKRFETPHELLSLGFECVGESLGWCWTDLKTTFNRRRCRANLDERRLSEEEYARELGWYKIYDAGHKKWIL